MALSVAQYVDDSSYPQNLHKVSKYSAEYTPLCFDLGMECFLSSNVQKFLTLNIHRYCGSQLVDSSLLFPLK